MSAEKLQQAVALIKSGDKDGGKNVLIDVVNSDPKNEAAWLWLATVVSPDKRIFCLEKVLSINPNNTRAMAHLEKLRASGPIQAGPALQQTPITQVGQEARSQHRALVIIFLVVGIGGNCINWTVAHTLGWFMPKLAFITASAAVTGLYFFLFPKKFYDHYAGKSNMLLIVVVIVSLLVGWLNFYAFEHGLY